MMRSRAPMLLALAALAGLVAAPSCREQGLPATRAGRVVVVSYDGLGADLAWQWIGSGLAAEPDGLAALAGQGLAVRRLRMASPTLTSVGHATLATGQPPSATGVVSNTFHRPGTPVTENVAGYAVSYQAPALWTAAARQGVRVATLMWPAADAGAVDRVGDLGVVWTRGALAPSEVLDLDPGLAGTTGELISKDGVAALRWDLELPLGKAEPASITLEVAAYDGTPDGLPRFDTVAARFGGDGSWMLAGEREWLSLELEARSARDERPRRYGLWAKPLYLDRARGGLRLYRGALWRLTGYPDDFEDRITDAVGPFPGLPDQRLLADWWLDMSTGIDLDTFVEQAERLDHWLDRITGWVLANEDVRLVMAYHPTPDEYQHSSLLVAPDQWAYSPGAALAAREGLKRIGRSVDRSVAALWGALDPGRDALVVVSDHGLVPIHSEVRVLLALEQAGLVEVVEDGGERRVAPTSPMAAGISGGCAHLYLNLAGRETGGVVARAEAGELLARAARAVADLELDGRPVAERILTRAEAAGLGLDHPNSGDLVVFLRPGFSFSSRLNGEAVVPSAVYASHGYLASHDSMCGVLLARGAGIARVEQAEMPATEVAPLIARWLGFELR
ncbi:MAG TPA: alkaline phosphatase family protein [Thermoanaerobaculales bacterium]|nr:alkaline phosphatase family protein [Thermoanaerobaculales bacterium]HPA79224.1 alkaline phosphatase family protein [Thermoanaerobaculales bacterium]HQL28730.1 alkaline phosphatase family protein [Thermoanaerobaculales bacterium]HQP42762.1 alkaline phosphatase family protein [Thermoanaerobaculales bacterium]